MLHKKYKNNIDIVTALANSLLERPIKEVVHEFKKLGLTTVVLSQDKNLKNTLLEPNKIFLYYTTGNNDGHDNQAFCTLSYL